jgi:hypothetical protein
MALNSSPQASGVFRIAGSSVTTHEPQEDGV